MNILDTQLLTIVATIKKAQAKIKDNTENIDKVREDLTNELLKFKDNVDKDLKKEVNTLIKSLDIIKGQFQDRTHELDKDLSSYAKENKKASTVLKSTLKDIEDKLLKLVSIDNFEKELKNIEQKFDKQEEDFNKKIKEVDKKIKPTDLTGYAKKSDIPKEIVKTEIIQEKLTEVIPNIKIGEVETLNPGEDAIVKVNRQDDEYTLDFGIPRGVTGASGRSGTNGLTTSVNGIEQVDGNVSLTTDDIPETSTNMYIPTLPVDTPTTKYLNGNKEWATVTGGVTDHTELTNLNGDSNYQHITTAEKAKVNTDYLKLDQTSVQTITGDIPLLAATRVINADNQLVDKKYVDDNDIAKITELNKTANYSNYAITDNGYKYTFNRTDNVITSITKEEI